MLAIFGIGLGLTTLHVAQNSLVQTLVSDRYRGRVMGLYMFLWAGLGTFGSYVVGQMAEMLHGVSATLAINAVICLGAVLLVRSRIMAAGRQIGPHAPAVSEEAVESPEVLPLRSASPPAITIEPQDAS
jgi:MFS family permease